MLLSIFWGTDTIFPKTGRARIKTIKLKTYDMQMGCININLKEDIISLSFSNITVQFSSVQSLSHVQLFEPHGLQNARPPCPSPTPGVYSNSCPFGDAIQPFHPCCPLLLPPSIFPSISVFSNASVLHISGQSMRVSASASVLPMNIQD